MVQQLSMPALDLGGSADEKALAQEVFNLARLRGFSYARSKPISLKLDDLAQYFAEQKYKGMEKPEEIAVLLDKALSASPVVFLREEVRPEAEIEPEDEAAVVVSKPSVYFRTTKDGKIPVKHELDYHSYHTRLFQGAMPVLPPTEEELAARAAEMVIHPSTNLNLSLPVAAPPVAPKPAATLPPAPTPVAPKPVATPPPAPVPAPVATKPAATPPAPVPAAKPPTPAPVAATPPPAKPAATPAPVTPEPVPAPRPGVVGPVEIEVADGLTIDLNQPIAAVLAEYGDYFATAVNQAIQEDFRFVNFTRDWYIEEITGRYNKGDFRRIREYMSDREGPVSDGDILGDLWGKRPTDNDYEATRFALNLRLSKEKKDFEFVGAYDDRVWTAPGLPQIGNPRHKATEVGTDFKYLEDTALNDPSELVEENGQHVWRHVLTFYEYENGVLPYDATAKALFPAPLMDDQKSLVLRFEAPQLYFTYTAELRYPTGNRGGWVGGLEQFFEDNLVPGAVLVIRQGKKSNHFTIEYEQSDEQNANVLFYDDRRQKFVFRPIVFACQIQPEGLLTPDRYSRINGQKRLEEADRKKTDQVVAAAFEYGGQKNKDGYYALLDDLYPIANIERPFSRNYLRQLLSHGNNVFQADETTPDAFTYKAPQSGVRR